MRQRAIRWHNLKALADSIVNRHDHGYLRGQVVRFAHVGVVRIVFLVSVVKTQRRDRRAQNFHWRRRRRKALQKIDHPLIENASECQLRRELAQLQRMRKNPVPQKIGRLLEGRFFSQLMDVDTAVRQNACVSVDPANARVGSNNSFQTLSSDDGRHSLWNSLFG